MSSVTGSLWLLDGERLERPRIEGDVRADVCVVGAGVAGLAVAYELPREGRSVVVLEAAHVAAGESGRTTAHFSNAIDDRYHAIERMHGEEAARLVAESHSRAIDRAVEIATEEGIECDLERLDGWLFAPAGEDASVLERELDAARRAGLADVSIATRAPIAWDTGPALRFPDQMQLHPVRFLAGLARAIEARGGRVYGSSRVVEVDGRAGFARCEHGPVVRAEAFVVATNTPFIDRTVIHTKQAPYQTYAIAAPVPQGAVPRGLYWDTLDPYHYVRLHTARGAFGPRDLLIVGGEDHKTGQEDRPEERWRRLETWARTLFRELGEVEARWSGEVLEPVDGLAFIGRNPLDSERVYVVTGDSGHGWTHGMIAGMLVRDLVLGRENGWAKLYDPARRTVRALGEFARENANVARQYASWLARGDVDDPAEIAPGEGALVRRGLEVLAVHRAPDGALHAVSAVCTHLGCLVRWNRAESTWDCPCHGSRFDPQGRVVHGPASKVLAPKELGAERPGGAAARGEDRARRDPAP